MAPKVSGHLVLMKRVVVSIMCCRYDADNSLRKLGHLLLEDAGEEKGTLQEMTLFYKNDKQNSLLVLYEIDHVQREARYLTTTGTLTPSGNICHFDRWRC